MGTAHINALARALATCRPQTYGTDKREIRTDYAWRLSCEIAANVCRDCNPQFDYKHFMDSCETLEAK